MQAGVVFGDNYHYYHKSHAERTLTLRDIQCELARELDLLEQMVSLLKSRPEGCGIAESHSSGSVGWLSTRMGALDNLDASPQTQLAARDSQLEQTTTTTASQSSEIKPS